MSRVRAITLLTAIAAMTTALAQDTTTRGSSAAIQAGGSSYVPAHVSPELQVAIRSRAARQSSAPATVESMTNALLERFPAKVQRQSMGGVAVQIVTPPVIPPENQDRVVMHLHGGSYTSGGGASGLIEPILLAHYLRMRIISVDYRMPPEHPFPAALDDAVAVWKQILHSKHASSAAIGGSSAGGGLTLATVMKLRELRVPLPAAIFAGTPWADLANMGDTMMLSVCGRPAGASRLSASGRLYAGTASLRDPLLSPVNGDFERFPPAILISGTRDRMLSDTVRVHRKLRLAGIEAELHVFEAMAHADYMLVPQSPESAEAFAEIARFFKQHLAHNSRQGGISRIEPSGVFPVPPSP
jgi:epsilon-lactone hydrolase